jgi:hypothetical protein
MPRRATHTSGEAWPRWIDKGGTTAMTARS